MSESRYVAWRKSSYSDGTGNCVEVAEAGGLIAIRDTKGGGHGAVLEFAEAAWREFVAGTKIGNQSR
jgi:hypothetical protein